MSIKELKETQGGYLDLSDFGIIEEVGSWFGVDVDINGNGQVGIGCLIGC